MIGNRIFPKAGLIIVETLVIVLSLRNNFAVVWRSLFGKVFCIACGGTQISGLSG